MASRATIMSHSNSTPPTTSSRGRDTASRLWPVMSRRRVSGSKVLPAEGDTSPLLCTALLWATPLLPPTMSRAPTGPSSLTTDVSITTSLRNTSSRPHSVPTDRPTSVLTTGGVLSPRQLSPGVSRRRSSWRNCPSSATSNSASDGVSWVTRAPAAMPTVWP